MLIYPYTYITYVIIYIYIILLLNITNVNIVANKNENCYLLVITYTIWNQYYGACLFSNFNKSKKNLYTYIKVNL